MFLKTLAMAAQPVAEGGGTASGSPLQFMPIILMVAIFYFVMIRPQRRREKERKAMISAVKTGQRVLLSSGIIGEVGTVKEKTILIQIAEKTRIEVLKSAVSQIIEKGDAIEEIKA